MRVVWSETQDSSFGASAGFASAAALASGLASLLGSCAAAGREADPKNSAPNTHMVKIVFISSPFDGLTPQLSPQDSTRQRKDKSNGGQRAWTLRRHARET